MKILMINVVCGIRSTGRICTDLATVLEAQGNDVKIAYGREEVPERFKKYAVRIGDNRDVQLHGIKARMLDGAGFGSKKATEKFIEWVKKYNPDVIHLHNIHGYYIHNKILFDYLRYSKKKIIWTLHDCWAFTGHSAYCDAIQCEKWKIGCSHCPQKDQYPKSYIDNSRRNWIKKRNIFSCIPNMQIVTPSNWLAGLVKQSFLSEYPVSVIHNGIDTSKFYPLENDFRQVYGLEGKKVLLGVASTWNDMKGYSDFIRLSSMLGEPYRIVLVGVSKAQKDLLPENVIGIEKTDSLKELAMIYSGSDLFINLTYCDTFPTVNLEAIACGKYVISYNTGGCPESIAEFGHTVVRGNLNSVKNAVEEYFDKPKLVVVDDEAVRQNDKALALKKYMDLYRISKVGGGVLPLKI